MISQSGMRLMGQIFELQEFRNEPLVAKAIFYSSFNLPINAGFGFILSHLRTIDVFLRGLFFKSRYRVEGLETL